MTKRTLKLIWDLNELYNELWNNWTKTKSWTKEFEDLSQKLKLIRVIIDHIEEKSRWFLKTKVDYVAWWKYILENQNLEFDIISKNIFNLMMWIS